LSGVRSDLGRFPERYCARVLVAFLSFTVASVLIVLLPGPDSLVVVRGLVRGGRRGGVLTAAGVLCGLLVWVTATALGVSALIRASEIGYDVLKVVGACYLVWLGVRSLLSVRRTTGAAMPVEAIEAMRSGFWAGFLTDILNPKVGVFFVSFLPGFVPTGQSVGWITLGFGLWFAALTAVYFAALVAISTTVATWMSTARIRRRLDALTGLVLVGFGLRLATEA
jgi:threonine/homoserine/homoserine lactone efflux protein